MRKCDLKTLLMSMMVVALSVGMILSCGGDDGDDSDDGDDGDDGENADGDTGGIDDTDGDTSDDDANSWDDSTVEELLDEACKSMVACGQFPDVAICVSSLEQNDYEKCELACFAGSSCERAPYCNDPSSGEYKSFCESTPMTDGDTPLDSHEFFEYCGAPRDTCEEHVCAYFGAYNICVNRDEDYCDDTLPCVKDYRDCACPGGTYDGSGEVECAAAATVCIADATPDPGDNDTDFDAGKCESDIQFMASQCGMATCSYGFTYNDCVSAGHDCSALNDCIQTYWDCTCTGGVYQGTETQYDCGVIYVECEKGLGF